MLPQKNYAFFLVVQEKRTSEAKKKADRKNGKQTTHLKNTVFEQTKSQKVQNRDFYRSFGYFPRAAWVEKGHVSDSPPTVCVESAV